MCLLGAVVLDAAATGVAGGVTLIAESDFGVRHFRLAATTVLEATSIRFTGGSVSISTYWNTGQWSRKVLGALNMGIVIDRCTLLKRSMYASVGPILSPRN